MRKIRGAVFGPCVGVGGGDGFASSLIRASWESIEWTGVFVSGGATPEQYERARYKTGGLVRFYQSFGRVAAKQTTESPFAEYHEDINEAARAAAHGADFVLSWHCLQTAEVAASIPNAVFVELVQNEDDFANQSAQASRSYASHFCAVSQAAGLNTFGTDFKVMPNAVEVDRVLPRIGRQSQRNLWEIDESEKVILFAGRFSYEKNPEAILDALTFLPSEYTALFVGQGPLAAQIENRAARTCAERVRIVDSRYHMGDVYAAADVFVLPSDFEGDSLAWKEALCAGLPCVCSRAGSLAETIEATQVPLAVEVSLRPSGEELAKAILQALLIPKEQRDAVRVFALDNFGISMQAAGWSGYLANVVYNHRLKQADFDRQETFHFLQSTPIRRIGEQRVLLGPGADKEESIEE